jgi:hypothetical protein
MHDESSDFGKKVRAVLNVDTGGADGGLQARFWFEVSGSLLLFEKGDQARHCALDVIAQDPLGLLGIA